MNLRYTENNSLLSDYFHITDFYSNNLIIKRHLCLKLTANNYRPIKFLSRLQLKNLNYGYSKS